MSSLCRNQFTRCYRDYSVPYRILHVIIPYLCLFLGGAPTHMRGTDISQQTRSRNLQKDQLRNPRLRLDNPVVKSTGAVSRASSHAPSPRSHHRRRGKIPEALSTKLSKPPVRSLNPDEREDLEALQSLICGIENPHPSWIAETPPCDWSGVECSVVADTSGAQKLMSLFSGESRSPSRRVTSIVWSARELRGTLASSISGKNLPPHLRVLNLNQNELYGDLAKIVLPESLKLLDLSDNMISVDVRSLSLPRELLELDLGANSLHGEVKDLRLPPGFNVS